MKLKMASPLAAMALGVAILAGSALPSQAQTTTAQPQATTAISTQPTAVTPGVWTWPTMWWPTASSTPGAASVTPQTPTSQQTVQPTSFWNCWWW